MADTDADADSGVSDDVAEVVPEEVAVAADVAVAEVDGDEPNDGVEEIVDAAVADADGVEDAVAVDVGETVLNAVFDAEAPRLTVAVAVAVADGDCTQARRTTLPLPPSPATTLPT